MYCRTSVSTSSSHNETCDRNVDPVASMCSTALATSRGVTVRLASVTWEFGTLVGPGTLRLSPYGYDGFGTFGERIVFPDFEVVHQPYRADQSIHPLGPLKDVPSSLPHA